MEKPVIATNVGGIYEMMEDKETGFLIKENDPEDLIEKLTILFDDKSLQEKMGINGKQFVIKKFNWDIIAKKFIENIKPYIKN
jgi:glycosyltransferase involved in cell wall biosynthesis